MVATEVRLHPRTFCIAVVGATVFALATVASSWAVRWVTDHVIVPRFEHDELDMAALAAGATMIIAIGLIRSVGVVVRRTWAGRTQYRVLATLRDDVVEHYQAQPYRWHRAHSTGELIAHAGVDAEAATEVLAPIPYSTGTVVLVITSAAWMLSTDAVLGIVAVALFPILIIQNIVFQRQGEIPANEAQERLGEVSALVHESLEAVTVVKSFGAEARESDRLHERASSLRGAKVRLARLRATFDLFLDAVPSYGNVVLILVGASRVNAGAATLGDITSFVYLFTLLVWPLRIIGFALGDLPHSLAGWDRVQGVLRDPPPAAPVADLAPTAGPAVAMRGVTFAYEPGRDVLHDIDLTIEVGTTVAVVGPTASGKSTLLAVLAGLLVPDRGEVAAVTPHPALVFQEPFLFAASLRSNVDVHGDASDDELRTALDLAQVTPVPGRASPRDRHGRGGAGRDALGRPASAHRPGSRAPGSAEGAPAGRRDLEPRPDHGGADPQRARGSAGRHHHDRGGEPAGHDRPGRRSALPGRRAGEGARSPRRAVRHRAWLPAPRGGVRA